MPSPYKLIPSSFEFLPSRAGDAVVDVQVSADVPAGAEAVGRFVAPDAALPEGGLDWNAVARVGFEAKPGQTLLVPQNGAPILVLVGIGAEALTPATLRDAAASFARAAHSFASVALVLPEVAFSAAKAGQVVAEGVLLARYRYTELKPTSTHIDLKAVTIIAEGEADDHVQQVSAGVRRGVTLAAAAAVARDLANTPPSHLTATDFGDIAIALGAASGFGVEVFDKAQLIELGTGGLLGVNAGSTEEPRMVKLTYTPAAALPTTPHLVFVGKGIMYDSGGISLKPSDPMHLLMKMDMAGAAAVLGAMTALASLECPVTVTGYLMCTDNMPSGSAMKLGDVLTIHGGTTVEVKNTDAEGRLVLSDALVLATELDPDAIVDIATLTGAALMALGTHTAAVFGNDQPLVQQLTRASEETDESIWQLPLEHRYRPQLASDVADIANLGGKYAGATTAALFLNDFVAGIPWAHLDIAGTMQAEKDDSWRSQGATGFGARLLIELALDFAPAKPRA
ncbi:leucyl aminopeptidase [Subtercola lobariae]|uniref:Probable cytosol aminopeptidase n=1 Tax=Subtercola lobariae TaxID=1588641 RepID=A0A917B264_9MICO|nr:leucyl aminopeptidase [Subtercola lobariae]GGF17789.1 putative cytosol aminopeptidase [Subtercola lobariae]